jgi:hypothetical protein
MPDTTHAAPTSTTEAARRLVDLTLAAWEPVFAALDDAWSSWSDAAVGSSRGGLLSPRAHRHHHAEGHRHGCGCGCDDRGHRCDERCDPCRCCGCNDEADVLVEAHAGERRLVPVTLHNPTRRPKTVSLVPGAWTSCTDPAPPVKAVVLPEGELTLGPCETREVVVAVAVGESDPTGDEGGVRLDAARCAVVSTDVAVTGCGRSFRLAVAVLPLSCGSLDLTCCDCGCC